MKKNIFPFDNVVATVPVTVPYEKKSEKSPHWFIGKAFSAMLARTNLKKSDIDGLALASYTLVPDSAAVMADYFKTEFSWVLDMPMGGVSGVIGLKRAARAIQVGDAEIIACIGADAMGNKNNFKSLIRNFSTFSRDHTYQYGAAGPSSLFAMKTSHYMDMFGAKMEDFGRICIAQREAAMENPLAMLRKPLSMEDYLCAMKLSDPLRLYDCVMPCSGAEGFLVMSAERALSLGLPTVKIGSAIESHNTYHDDDIQFRSGWAKYSEDMYHAASLGPEDMSFLQAYDDYPVMVMIQMEDLGFCKKGEGPQFVRETSLTVQGKGLALNTCGGMLSAGQAGAAGGFMSVVEAIRQLTGEPLGLQVPAATAGVVSGYGYVNYDRGICAAAAILQSSD